MHWMQCRVEKSDLHQQRRLIPIDVLIGHAAPSVMVVRSPSYGGITAAASGHATAPPAQVSPEKSWLAGAGPHESHTPGAGISKSVPSLPSSPGKASRLHWGSAA